MQSMKIYGLVAMLLVGVPTAFAADAGEGKIALGVQGGLTFPDFRVSNTTLASQYGNKNGWLGGAYLEFGLWTITLRPEINFVEKGYTVANVAEVRNRYLEIPVLVKINPLSGAPVSPFIVVGPQWSRQMNSSVTTLGSTTTFNNTADRWDISAVAGLGIEFNISENVALNLQGRYSYGLRDVDSSTKLIKTRGFYALSGLTFQSMF